MPKDFRKQSVKDATGLGPVSNRDNKPIVRRRPMPGGKTQGLGGSKPESQK
jgi:hypothetical protein